MEVKFRVICGIAFGMKELHSKGILHHDLKPANVLLDSSYTAKLADFGLSSIANQTTTQTMAGAGTIPFPVSLRFSFTLGLPQAPLHIKHPNYLERWLAQVIRTATRTRARLCLMSDATCMHSGS